MCRHCLSKAEYLLNMLNLVIINSQTYYYIEEEVLFPCTPNILFNMLNGSEHSA